MNKIISVKNKCVQTKKIAGFNFSDESFSQLKEKVIGKKLMVSNSDRLEDWIGNIIEVTSDGFKIEVVNPKFEDIIYENMLVNLDIQTLNNGNKIEEVISINKIIVKPPNQFDEVEIKKSER